MSLPAYEKMGAFYLGRRVKDAAGTPTDETILYDAKDLTTHAMCVGMTGSGKTGLCIGLLEEAAMDGVPAIAIDPKGDLGNLLLTFPDLRPEDFAPWVEEAQAARKGLAFGLQLPAGALVLHTDQRALHQILINLVGNAIKFTAHGSVALQLDAGTEHSPWRFRVHDTGAGIAPDDQQRQFLAFSRLEAAERDAIEGTGLGLHLSRKLAQALGGTLELESSSGHGSTFTLSLPGTPGALTPSPHGAEAARPPRA